MSERSTDIDLVREAVHQKRSLRAAAVRRSSSKSSSRLGSTHTSTDDLDTISVVERQESDKVKTIQSRPLPQLPPTTSADHTNNSDNTDNKTETEQHNTSTPKLQMR